MGLKDLVTKGAKLAMTSIGDLKSTVTYRAITLGAYDPLTNKNAETVRTVTFQGVLVRGKVDEDDDTTPNDNSVRLIVSVLDMPAIVPKETHNLLINGLTWEIVTIRYVPGDPIYIFNIRRP